jgi:hypothetical protein
LTRNRQVDRFCKLDQRRRIAIGQEVPLALDAVKPQLALEVLLGGFCGLGLAQHPARAHPLLTRAGHPRRRSKPKTD